MYSLVAKEAAIQKNSAKYPNPKTEYFQEKTKELMEKGYSRKNARAIIRQSMDKTGEIGPSDFASKNLRKTRRNRSERLKVPFNPLYNGPRYKVNRIQNEEGIWIEELRQI